MRLEIKQLLYISHSDRARCVPEGAGPIWGRYGNKGRFLVYTDQCSLLSGFSVGVLRAFRGSWGESH